MRVGPGRCPRWLRILGSCSRAGVAALWLVGCAPDPELQPDEVLQAELGLTLRDRVHRVALSGGDVERADPAAIAVDPGAYVEFITTDWLVHELIFDADSLSGEQWAFLERTDQVASPPLVQRESRYVLAFESAPPGRYPYRLEGNAREGRGVIVVTAPDAR